MSKDLLRDQWASLGVAFNSKSSLVCDPENALINFLNSGEFPEDRKMITLILAWLKEYSNFVHIERLKSQIDSLGSFELAVLGGLALKCVQFGDFRWRTIISFVKKRNTGKLSFESHESEYLLAKNGEDLEFKEFGLRVSKIEPERAEKILELKQIIKKNRWIHHRILFGVNMRADVATVVVLKLAGSAYQASKYLKCSFNAASRNWNDLEIVNFDT
jgi:hypothetical protein